MRESRRGETVDVPPDPAAKDDSWPDRWPRHDALELAALPSAVPCARARTREILWEWRLDHLAEAAELVVAEILANAVQATRAGHHLRPVRIWLLADPARILILVWDGAAGVPVVAVPADDDTHGRGLMLVEAFAARWGYYRPPRPDSGKVVWAVVQA
jgi:anti-sigma regulatory factor (Ser/Thr protein kinase)